MKKIIRKYLIAPILFLAMTINLFGYGDGKTGRATTLEKGTWQVGLFQPLSYGLSDKAEISTHPLLFVKIPNMSYKRNWINDGKKTVSTNHVVTYPTPLLNTLAKEGIGGMISPEFEMPAMISLYQEGLYSREIFGSMFTGRAGFGFGYSSEELDSRTTIDIPIAFNRLAVFYGNFQLRFGADFDGLLNKRFGYHVDGLLFLTPGIDEKLAFEHKTMITWHKSEKFRISAGYKIVYGQYPFGNQWNLVPPRIPLLPVWVPLFDLVWTW